MKNTTMKNIAKVSLLIATSVIAYRLGYTHGVATPEDKTVISKDQVQVYNEGYAAGLKFFQTDNALATVVMRGDVIKGLQFQEDSEMTGILLAANVFLKNCTEKNGYILQTPHCFGQFSQMTGERSESDPLDHGFSIKDGQYVK